MSEISDKKLYALVRNEGSGAIEVCLIVDEDGGLTSVTAIYMADIQYHGDPKSMLSDILAPDQPL